MNNNLAYKVNDFNRLEEVDQQKEIHNRNNSSNKTNNQITIKLFGHKYKLRESAKKFYENLLGWGIAVGIIFLLMQAGLIIQVGF